MSESIIEKLASRLDIPDGIQKKFTGLLENYRNLNEAEKAEFLNTAKDKLEKFTRSIKRERSYVQQLIPSNQTLFLTAVIFIVLIFVFFGYKLYKSLSERERKREEKKKSKQMKKKK